MFKRTIKLLCLVGWNGLISIFIAAALYVLFILILGFALIPVKVIAGKNVVDVIADVVTDTVTVRIFYIVVFISMMMDDLGMQGYKSKLLRVLRLKH